MSRSPKGKGSHEFRYSWHNGCHVNLKERVPKDKLNQVS